MSPIGKSAPKADRQDTTTLRTLGVEDNNLAWILAIKIRITKQQTLFSETKDERRKTALLRHDVYTIIKLYKP
jgi:hypothetical protein